MRLSVYCVVSLCVAWVSSSPQVQLPRSTVMGEGHYWTRSSFFFLDFFGGIPYVEPPLGPLRLRPPVFKPHLDAGVFNASSFGLSCLQPGMSTDLMSEDCLTINIFRPSSANELSSLPVLFWTQ
ncbi:alpha/beta-hydrolase [Armillaria gallica]|uniref:Alpha/beta-hydrolase n=1 Tax=Armillaria gallica TaxID=47427 RepID=A0A2H3DGY1_ARMGA|nr:alpha/beta-hydrolase [Armillaria gallica]